MFSMTTCVGLHTENDCGVSLFASVPSDRDRPGLNILAIASSSGKSPVLVLDLLSATYIPEQHVTCHSVFNQTMKVKQPCRTTRLGWQYHHRCLLLLL